MQLFWKTAMPLFSFVIVFIFIAHVVRGQSSEDVIKLPKPRLDSEISVEQAISERRSIRSYKDEPLSLSEISQILWAAYGITQKMENAPEFIRGGLRAAPSAGARYPLEIYVVVGNVKGLSSGIYEYDSQHHRLIRIQQGDKRVELSKAGLGQSHIKNAAADLVYTAVFERTTSKYGKRGLERYVCMDLGHSAENVYLQAHALDIGTCAVGAFKDNEVREVMNLPDEEEPLYIMPLGKLKK